jgi:hypothetical protein
VPAPLHGNSGLTQIQESPSSQPLFSAVLGQTARVQERSNAAGGNDGTTSTGGSRPAPSAAPDPQKPWGPQRSDETPLTGDILASVKAAALERVPNATIARIENGADGHAAYEAHLVKADGTPATVYVDKQFDVVGSTPAEPIEQGSPGPRVAAGPHGSSRRKRPSSTVTMERRAFGSTGPVRR